MMKKYIALFAALILMLLSAAAIAEENTETAPFSFRKGITWGMSMDEVRAFERELGSAPDGVETAPNDHIRRLEYFIVSVSKYSGGLKYFFAGDQLVLACYEVRASLNSDSAEYLREALISLYGEGKPDDLQTLIAWGCELEAPESTPSEASLGHLDEVLRWTPFDHTSVWYASDDQGDCYIVYVDDSVDPSEIGRYNTFGL